MVRSTLLVSLLAAASTAFGKRPDVKKAKTRVPGAYIFEFDEAHDSADFLSSLSSEGTTRMNLDYKLFKGLSVQLHDVEKADEKAVKLASAPAVKNFWPVEVYDIPTPKVKWTGEPTPDGSSALQKRANSSDTFSPHVMTQVDKLRAKGITGKGIKIAVIDTGIDYLHPALGGCFGEGCLVSFGTDLVGDDYTGFNTPVPDDDPIDCAGHGSHVAGIIAAQENEYGFTGAAPDAILGAYRVFGCDGSAGNDVLIAAYNQAFEDGADIITASIGGPSGWSEDPWAVAVSRIVEQGVPCTVSAGNEGDSGLFYASTAANGKKVTAIASYDNTYTPTLLYVSQYSIDGGDDTQFGYTPAEPSAWEGISLPVWAPSLDTADPSGGCDAYPDDTPDLSEYIVLVRRGDCLFTVKAANAAAKGAKYLMIYNNVAGTISIDVSTVDGIVAAGMVTPDVGAEWINALADGSEVVLTVTSPEEAETFLITPENPSTGGALSTFTTWGPTWEMDVKPQVGAPGGSILSTYPRALGSYAVLSGTSMACPITAGIVALIAEVRGTFDPVLIENLLSSTANPQLFNDGASFYEFLAPVAQQGGGLVQAYDAAFATTILEPSSLSFNDSANAIEVLNFTLTNTGKEEVSFDISHVPTISMYTLDEGSIYPAIFPNEPSDSYATLEFSESKVTIAAGDSVTIEVVPTPPGDLDADRLPLWSGWVAVNGSDGSSLSIPYQGLVGSLHDHVVLGSEDAWISRSGDDTYTPVPDNTTFTLPVPGSTNSSGVLPTIDIYLALGSPKVRADIVPLTTCPPNTTTEFRGIKTIGQPQGFPYEYLPRGINPVDWDGELDSGLFAPPGKYKIVARALRIFGDEDDEDDWADVAETPAFRIKYA